LEADRYLVTLTDESGVGFSRVEFIQPTGTSLEEFLEEADMGDVLDSYSDSLISGGVTALGGGTNRFVVDFEPGEWIAWGGTSAMQAPLIFEVTGEMPTDPAEPKAEATITIDEIEIGVTDGELTAGMQIVRIDNMGAQPRAIHWLQGPDGMTEGQIRVMETEEQEAIASGAEPEWSGLSFEDLAYLMLSGLQSPDVSAWLEVELEAGTYALFNLTYEDEPTEPLFVVVELAY
jgi:hypothetical protein